MAILLLAADAGAQTFNRVTSCSSTTQIPLGTNLSTATNDWQKASGTSNLSNHLRYEGTLAANPNVSLLRLWASSFNLENGYDKFSLIDQYGTTDYTGSMVGPLNAYPANGGIASYRLTTDSSVGSSGFNMSWVSASCTPGRSDFDVTTPDFLTHVGVLLATQDTVYHRTSPAPSGSDINVALWRDTDAVDFDLYARCGARPTPTTHYAVSWQSGAHEYLQLPAAACPSGAWFFAVNSYSGSGAYKLLWNYAKTGGEQNVCYFNEATTAQKQQFQTTFYNAQRILFGMTQGEFVQPVFALKPESQCVPSAVNISITSSCAGSPSPFGGSYSFPFAYVKICPDCWANPNCVAHELGHGYLGLADEYNASGSPNCGHSIMNSAFWGWNTDLCNSSNHGRDPSPGVPGNTATPAWDQAVDVYHTLPSKNNVVTPDGYDFMSHPLQGVVTTLQ